MVTRNKKKLYQDLIALLAFTFVFACLWFSQPLGIGLVDEQFYHTIVKRILQGEGLFVNEWHLSQLFSVLLILPCKAYLRLFGSAGGIILAIRRLWLVCQLFSGGYVYCKLRDHGFTALLFSLALCVFFPYYTFTYYSFAINGVVLILVTVFTAKKPLPAGVLAGLGVLAALTVLAEPILAVAYFLYSAQTLTLWILKKKGRARERKAAAFPSLRTWTFISAGILPVFAAFMTWLFISGGASFRPLLRVIPELFTGKEYSFDMGYDSNNVFRFGAKLVRLFGLFGYVPPLLMASVGIVLAALRQKKPGLLRSPRVRAAALLFLLLCFASCYLFLWNQVYVQRLYRETTVDNIAMRGAFLPVLLFAAAGLPLVKEPPKLCFGFLQTGIIVSLLVDFSSDNCLCYGGVITLFPACICFRALLTETLRRGSDEKSGVPAEKRKNPAAVARGAAVCLAGAMAAGCLLFWCGRSFVRCALLPTVGYARTVNASHPVLERIETGPFCGLRVIPAVKEVCEAAETDLNAADAAGEGPVYVNALCPLAYLYSDRLMGCYSSFYVPEDFPDRLLRYWELNPEKIPSVIYLPYYDYMTVSYFDRLTVQKLYETNDSEGRLSARMFFDKKTQAETLALFKTIFRCEIAEGEAGYILHVLGSA